MAFRPICEDDDRRKDRRDGQLPIRENRFRRDRELPRASFAFENFARPVDIYRQAATRRTDRRALRLWPAQFAKGVVSLLLRQARDLTQAEAVRLLR